MGAPIVHALIQPRKTNNINNKGARIKGNGEVSGGNTISPNQAIRRREGRRFANGLTHSVRVQNLMSEPAIHVLADDSEVPSLRDNSDFSGEDCDQQLLIGEPLAENVLTQDILNEIGNTDDVDNEASVTGEDGPSTPTSGECIDRLAEVNEKKRLPTTQEHLTPATQEAAVSMIEDERLLLMNILQLLTQGTQEVAAADASVAGFTQNHSSSQEDVTASTGFDALVQDQTSGPDRQKVEGVRYAHSLMNAPISSQLTPDHSDDGG